MPSKTTTNQKSELKSPWWWVPSLYYAEGIPYAVVMLVSVIFYKRMGISNTDIALYTSWLYLPWVIKPLWSPVIDILRTKRFWIVTMQLIIGAGLGGIALTIPAPDFFKLTLGFFWLLAFSSATHDIAADGFYMLGLSQHKQAWFVGIRSTFYRFAMITGQGLLIIFAGYIESHTGLPALDIDVFATPQAKVGNLLNIDSLDRSPLPGELRIVSDPKILRINPVPRNRSEIDSIISMAKQWNSPGERNTTEGNDHASVNTTEPTWWGETVVLPLETFLKKHFGQSTEITVGDKAGNVGLLAIRLSNKPEPGQEIVVNFGRVAGDKSIALAEGGRMIFTEGNWNRPYLIVIQLDPKLKQATKATFKARAGNIPLAWTITFLIIAVLFILFFIYHKFILPYPSQDRPATETKNFFADFFLTFASFFRKDRIAVAIIFILFYRFGEAQLVKLATPFMLDAQEIGGLALTTGQVGFVYGTLGLIMLTLGGILGGVLAARNGLKYWIWWMALAMKLPDSVYVYLAYAQPDNFAVINLCVAIEQFGYGFGFTAYMLFLIYVSEGEHKTAHYAICTGFMALGMMIPGMFSGWLQEIIGYQHFFIWVLFATIPGLILIKYISIDPEFGKRRRSK
ncbi:MAG: AmpG family muropeptide MFS transporter [FCB group bacterium]|nr:AmpG family muropeptide MFS transporter [FCB group bacterium]